MQIDWENMGFDFHMDTAKLKVKIKLTIIL